MSNIKFVKENSPTHTRMWDEIKTKFGDVACLCPNTGEVWQYMGSLIDPLTNLQEVEHQFRHRSHLGKREYWSIYEKRELCAEDFNI